MVNLKISIFAAAISLLPNALLARTHGHPHAGYPLTSGPAKGLAKAAAVSAKLANPITRQDLVGFWNTHSVDSSDTSYRYYDTAEVYFGNNGEFDSRNRTTGITLSDGGIWSSSSHEMGTWTLTDAGLIMDGHECRYLDSDTTWSQDSCFGADTLPTEGWEIKTSGGRKVWSMPITQTDTTLLYYASADPHFTLPNLLPASLAPRLPHGQLRQGKSFSFYPGNQVFSTRPLLDLRGKAIAPGHQGQGRYYSSGNVPNRY